MIYELKDTSKAAALFAGIEDSMVRTCLQGLMGGKVYVTDPEHPRSALAYCACFSWYAGEPDRELIAFKPKGVVGMVPPDEAWAKLIEECWPDADKVTRYAIKKDTKFDREKLEVIVAALPEGYELHRIDEAIYDLIAEDDLFEDCVCHFASKAQFFELGRGYAVLKDGKPVSVASSYSVYREGIEIEIDTAPEERRKGLASVACAKLILSCLDDGLYPSWDAANLNSVHLAEKLGYEFSHEYPCYWLDEIIDRALPNPDKSGWDALCGVYEGASEPYKHFTVLRKNGDLYVNFVSRDGDPLEMKLFPVAENGFGLMWGDDEIVFSDGCMTVDGIPHRRLPETHREDAMEKNTKMQSLAREAFEKGIFNGTWLLAEHGEIVSRGAVGWLDPENKQPMREDSLFDLASVSKQFTASAILLLRRQGLLNLDDEITKFFPEIPYKGVTIRMLLNHTSGLPDYMKWVDQLAKRENRVPGNDAVLRFLVESGAKMRFTPGEKHEYCNTGYCLLAQIVEKLSGVPFEDFMRDNIFEPAGMHATRVRHPRKDGAAFENWARAMILEEGKFILPEQSKRDDYVTALDGEAGDGYVYSNIFDLFRWDQALREGKILTQEEQALMYTPGVKVAEDEEGEIGYGFGWYLFNSPKLGCVASHSGGWPGVSTWFGRYLDADMVLILLGCRDVDEMGGSAFYRAMSAVARGEEPKPFHSIEELELKDPDKSKWASFCGKYEPDPEDDYIDEVVLKDGELWANIVSDLERRYALKLYPIGENTFAFKEDDIEIVFEDGCMKIDDETVKKL